jgi:hypothetical protein
VGSVTPPGPNFEKAICETSDDSFLGLVTNGLASVAVRTVFHAGGNGFRIICPACQATAENIEGWGDAAQEWYDSNGPGILTCPRCGNVEPVTEWGYDPPYGFGNLGFTFWNWPPLKPSFVAEVSQRLGHRTVLVVGKV